MVKRLVEWCGVSPRSALTLVLVASAMLMPVTDILAAELTATRRVQQETAVLHFDLSGVVDKARVFSLSEPERLVVDLPSTTLADDLTSQDFPDGVVRRIRYGEKDDGSLRIVVDLRRAVDSSHRFVPRQDGQRLLIDLGVRGDPARSGSQRAKPEPPPLRDVIIAIDAGHGGKDPGAIGRDNTHEKTVVMEVSRYLESWLANVPGIVPVLIRSDDTYIGLRKRIKRARQARADLFVSIHADAVPHANARGSSVYALSLDGATSEAAEWLARSENESAALYGDVALEGMDQGLRETLLNLAQSSTLEASLEVGGSVLEELAELGPVHRATVEQADFAVLKSPDIPSVLVETAFISNPDEERKLNDPDYQKRLAEAIGRGMVAYLARRAPVGTWLHAERYKGGS